jgi:class 3 adenylate cyclase
MSSPAPATGAVLFADVVGSARIYGRLGDAAAQTLVLGTLGRVGEIAARLGGEVVKTIGDEILLLLPDADAAVAVAAATHEQLRQGEVAGEAPVQMRIGLHWGEVLRRDGDVFGVTVNLAARLAGVAGPRQILTTAETARRLGPAWVSRTRPWPAGHLKGFPPDLEVCQVLWEDEGADVTCLAPGLTTAAGSPGTAGPLRLVCAGRTVEVPPGTEAFLLGRAEGCHVVVPGTHASRQHARVEHRGVAYVLIDQSTNGTWVRTDGSGERVLRREELPLFGRGWIGLGHPPDPAHPATLRFEAP